MIGFGPLRKSSMIDERLVPKHSLQEYKRCRSEESSVGWAKVPSVAMAAVSARQSYYPEALAQVLLGWCMDSLVSARLILSVVATPHEMVWVVDS